MAKKGLNGLRMAVFSKETPDSRILLATCEGIFLFPIKQFLLQSFLQPHATFTCHMSWPW